MPRRAVLPAVVLALLCVTLGWRTFLLLQIPIWAAAGAAGIWLFYVQHQFEDAYWESGESWTYADAALKGSSYLKLPQPLQFFTGNIGLHHVHHLSARIPNYNLQRAHDENEIFHEVPTITMLDGIRTSRLKLWDAQRGRLVTFAEARCRPEADALLHSVLDSPITVLHGRSGLGKTSLLQAALFPALRAQHHLPVYVRLDFKADALPIADQLRTTLRQTLQAEVPDARMPGDDESVWEYLHRADFELWSTRNFLLTHVIVIARNSIRWTFIRVLPWGRGGSHEP